MSSPLAFFLTWTTYGTWLPGDDRWWVEPCKGIQMPDPDRRAAAQTLMRSSSCKLDPAQREIVEQTIADHCNIRSWELHAANCRSNHVHVVVSASLHPKSILAQFKSYCTRRLKDRQRNQRLSVRNDWWTEGGSKRYLNSEASVEAAVEYVLFGQDHHQRETPSPN